MSGRVLVLGAAGRLGRAAAEMFRDAGWQVASLVRGRAASRAAPGTEVITLDARDTESVAEAAAGADVVLHALNVPYTQWQTEAFRLAETAVAAARAAGATLMMPGNVYGYGAGMPAVLDEDTPMRPTSRKGALRVAIEERLRAESEDGLRVVILRAGDFYGGDAGGWLDRVVLNHISHGRLAYPGPLDVVHPWAYLPDLAATFPKLAAVRDTLPPFASFGFAGHAVTGRELIDAIVHALGRAFKIDRMQWWMLRLAAPVVPVFRELVDIDYLWTVPHRIDERRLAATIDAIPHTPFEAALAAALYELGATRRA
ncbi:NAD(P)H-binding protein [Rhodoplanes sp. TEM]|uniref:NAD(P)H-binding protein n=1 Tax=Rhodoplanes tepidamans TaxID=200616 RepID=A0ABT5JCR0_RHOTP|nr:MULTISPECIES: NAD-dependent epimerase/dehydratase family protein [Rhodoplanes]MDC7786845.1 NAD(P)H-binding protein [Rhodoplanes tepidamans]MDC7984226.1 NAD(P)H-binding protein [Rhodoplanes sp. TEM]MDQ0355973.1 nucleoside-diphosphate-sugar epimerase [Rhodoplanes tepidamans]